MRLLIFATLFTLVTQPSIARPQAFRQLVITPSAESAQNESILQISPNGDITGHSIPVIALVSLGYNVPANPSPRVSSLPEWAVERKFDIKAKAQISFRFPSGDAAKQTQEVQQSVRRLLADGFGLVVDEREERVPVYALVVQKTGAKLNETRTNECVFDTRPKGCHSFAPGFGHPLNANGVSMSDLAHYLENWTDSPVIDRTALNDVFEIRSPGWKPMNLPPPPPGMAASGDEFASLPSLSAVLEKLGLELRQQVDRVPFYIVERIHEPDMK